MPGKLVTLTLITTLAATSVFAQRRDFRKERAELARQEREEKRRLREEHPRLAAADYGSNILRIYPITAMDVGVGFGLSYERIFGAEKMVGLVLPVHLMLEDEGSFDPFFSGGNGDRYNTYVYFTPGLKIYPFGQRKVTYAVGPNLLLGYGGGEQWRYNYNGVSEWTNVSKLRIGLMVNNYVNFQIARSFNLGLEAGLGVRYIDRETYDSPSTGRNSYSNGINVTGQFSLTLGYRF